MIYKEYATTLRRLAPSAEPLFLLAPESAALGEALEPMRLQGEAS